MFDRGVFQPGSSRVGGLEGWSFRFDRSLLLRRSKPAGALKVRQASDSEATG